MHSGIEKTAASHFQHAATKPCTNESNKKRGLGFSLYQSYINSEDLSAKPKRQISWFFKSNLCSAPGWHICSLELWIWWHLLHQLAKELLEESQVPQALPWCFVIWWKCNINQVRLVFWSHRGIMFVKSMFSKITHFFPGHLTPPTSTLPPSSTSGRCAACAAPVLATLALRACHRQRSRPWD